jgi:Photosynthetic reaction centre cytochrome C subunit
MRLTISLMLLLLPLCAQPPQEGGRKGGGGGGQPPKNLKILTPDELRSGVMMQFTRALGVRCDHCHAPATDGGRPDFASDANPKKETARMMIAMAKDINSKFPDGAAKVRVTCYTCHNGKVTPATAPPATPPAQ